MHELSIATDLVNTALRTARENNAKKVLAVTIEAGELAMVNPEQLEFMFDILVEDNMMKGAKLKIETVPAAASARTAAIRALSRTASRARALSAA